LIRDLDVSDACKRLAAFALDRLVMQLSAHCRWKPTGESMIDMFGRHAIGMVWDFLEASPGVGSASIFRGWIEQMARLIEFIHPLGLHPAQVVRGDATNCPLPDQACSVWFTDPPYYDSIPYAHLADCFYVWLKRVLPGFSSKLTTKAGECVVDRPHSLSASTKDITYFEHKIADAATEGHRLLSESGCASMFLRIRQLKAGKLC
jgi:adenine-specific DNA methylase